ncbi:MAG: 50S ribosomal protein L3 N(5)-glutamine methyltransferase [Burkholderiales bacterium]|nr:50S ribosomal protein L3 N(5)-glutamine methyltransferase [Burkholderiales bacterium]
MSTLAETTIDALISQAQIKFKTLRDWLRFGVSLFNQNELFYGHGTSNAHDEVVYLILNSLNLPLHMLEPYLDAIILDSEATLIANRFKQRVVAKLPAPYITHEAIIQGYSFYVDERAIIPRSFIPEILLANKLLPWLEQMGSIETVLDLCTGNGSIAIIAADYFSQSKIIAADIDVKALEIAKINIVKYALEDQIKLVRSDLWENLPPQRFDIILSNPPYVDQLRMEQLNEEYLHEPQHALSGGIDGLNFIHKILKNATRYLNDHGILVVEMGDNRCELEEIYPELPFTWLDTESGEGIIFVLTATQLRAYFK